MANELEALEKRQLSAQRSLNDLTNQLTLADHLVYKKYLAELQNYGMVTLSQEMLNEKLTGICRCGKVSGNPNPGGIEELCCRA